MQEEVHTGVDKRRRYRRAVGTEPRHEHHHPDDRAQDPNPLAAGDESGPSESPEEVAEHLIYGEDNCAGCQDQKQSRYVPVSLSLIHISEPTRLGMISYAVF